MGAGLIMCFIWEIKDGKKLNETVPLQYYFKTKNPILTVCESVDIFLPPAKSVCFIVTSAVVTVGYLY